MGYTNSSLVSYTKLSPNHSGQRTHSIDRITPHCVVGLCTAEGLGDWFAKSSTQASSNYGIDKNGRVGMYVEEKNRSWCSSSGANDQRAITIECASDTKEPYTFPDITYQKLIELCIDICRRNGKNKLIWFGDKDKTLNYEPKSGEMVLTVHRWFANKSCPGDWMYARMGDLASKVTARLGSSDSTASKGFQASSYCTVQGTVTTPTPAKKSVDEIAKEVINGKWGNGDARKKALTDAGYDYTAVQTKVNSLLSGSTASASKSIDEIAKEVINGKWGNGQDRVNRLTKAGYDAKAVQKRVNQMLS